MFSKINNKIKNFTWKDWLNVALWVLAFIMLIVFVIVSAVLDKDNTKIYANSLAGVGLGFGVTLIIALFSTVITSYLKGGKKND